ncbi:hypothetical protein MPH_06323 [Macrophomina phaseolina MS6]|uniref:Uncharacterized protein n=1 Tax=Macrophomina phaseolina (strain MS6) TaxID=1126212 RepID=K2RV43_MACPH|nr:hypothetical protein MPH_06323 [Macrophomina phaseolina MS6]
MRCTAFSSRSSRLLLSLSLFSSNSTRSSSFARALRSSATISLACENSVAVSSSSSLLIAVTLLSASCRRLLSFSRALRSSISCGRAPGSGGTAPEGGTLAEIEEEDLRRPRRDVMREVRLLEPAGFAVRGLLSSPAGVAAALLRVAEGLTAAALALAWRALRWRSSSS